MVHDKPIEKAKMEENKSTNSNDEKPKSPSVDDEDFEPSAEMMIHDFDDETTLNREEDQDNIETNAEELADLTKEGEMPLEELMALYYGNNEEKTEEREAEWNAEANDNENEDKGESSSEKQEMMTRRTLRSTAVLNARISDSDSSDEVEESVFHEDEWKKPRIGEEYQVSEIPCLVSPQDQNYLHAEDKQIWVPWNLPADMVEQYLVEVAGAGNDLESLPAGCHIQDNEDALFLLRQCNNSPAEALKRFKSRPNALDNELRVWSEEECKQFELGLTVYGKDFYLIHLNKVKTKSVRDIVKFYYIWKKSERYDHFTAKTRLGKKKEALHPGVTDYMDRLLDETDNAATSALMSHSGGEFLKYHPAAHSSALRDYLREMHVAQAPDDVVEVAGGEYGDHNDAERGEISDQQHDKPQTSDGIRHTQTNSQSNCLNNTPHLKERGDGEANLRSLIPIPKLSPTGEPKINECGELG